MAAIKANADIAGMARSYTSRTVGWVERSDTHHSTFTQQTSRAGAALVQFRPSRLRHPLGERIHGYVTRKPALPRAAHFNYL
jgi:hypothetical protein